MGTLAPSDDGSVGSSSAAPLPQHPVSRWVAEEFLPGAQSQRCWPAEPGKIFTRALENIRRGSTQDSSLVLGSSVLQAPLITEPTKNAKNSPAQDIHDFLSARDKDAYHAMPEEPSNGGDGPAPANAVPSPT